VNVEGAAMTDKPLIKFVVLVDGDPFDVRTDSGRAPNMIRELARRGALVKAVSTEPPVLLDNALKVWSKWIMRRQRETWTAVHLHPLRRFASAAIGRARCWRVRHEADAWLQIGLMVDSELVPLPAGSFRCCLFDDNHATFVKSRYYRPQRMGRFDEVLLDYEKKTCREMSLVLAQSDRLRGSFIDDYEVDPHHVVNIKNGINVDPLPDRPSPRGGPPVFLFVGMDFERKGGFDVLAAFARVRASMPDAQLRIVGPELNPMREPIPGVEFVGYVSRATPDGERRFRRELSEATIFVMPSLREGVGNVYLEAMAFALPCIGTRIFSIPEIIDDGVTGLLVDPGDSDALGAAMLKLGQDQALANSMGQAGYDRVHADFTWEKVVDKLIAEVASRRDS
jgi:glycosyltransferase involved in cell wall biosynthesis